MKKYIKALPLIILLIVMFTPKAKAVTNLSNADYDKLRNVFSEARIAVMSDADAERYLSYDLANATTQKKYYLVYENLNNNTYVEITEEQAMSGYMPKSTTHPTNSKVIEISKASAGGSSYFINLTTQWLVTPAKKSFDVSAIRTVNASVVEGSQSGMQIYWANASQGYQIVSYSSNGSNISKKSNGFGISMNLVDAASYFECSIDSVVTATSSNAVVYGSYQHATHNVTLAQSQNYTLSHNGYGNVINFAPSVDDYYDGMGGVDISL